MHTVAISGPLDDAIESNTNHIHPTTAITRNKYREYLIPFQLGVSLASISSSVTKIETGLGICLSLRPVSFWTGSALPFPLVIGAPVFEKGSLPKRNFTPFILYVNQTKTTLAGGFCFISSSILFRSLVFPSVRSFYGNAIIFHCESLRNPQYRINKSHLSMDGFKLNYSTTSFR
jgi:hypothetical protein